MTTDREKRRQAAIARVQIAAMMSLALSMGGGDPGAPEFPDVAGYPPRPEGYGVHLSKAERKGKTPEQLQAMRQAKMSQEVTT